MATALEGTDDLMGDVPLQGMNVPSSSVRAGLLLVRINALWWVAFGIITAIGLHPALPDRDAIKWTLAFLAIGCGGALIGVAATLKRRSRLAYSFGIGTLIGIALLTLTDQFGLADLAVLLGDLAALGFLIKDRHWYLGATSRVLQGG